MDISAAPSARPVIFSTCGSWAAVGLVRFPFASKVSVPVAIGVVLPLVLILLFGYGMSLDVKNVPVAIVMEQPSPETNALAAGFQLKSILDQRAEQRVGLIARKPPLNAVGLGLNIPPFRSNPGWPA